MKNESQVNEASLDASSSPPLTSSLHSRNSASSAQESAYLHQASALRWTRFGLSTLVIGMALAVIGCTGHVLHCYNQTHLDPEWFLPLWPADVDIKPTLGLMIPGTIITVMSLAYVVFAIVPSPRSRTLHQVLLFLGASLASFIATLFAVLFYHLLLYHFDVDTRDSLQTWTCKLYYSAQEYEGDTTDLKQYMSVDTLTPAGFKRLCMENMTAQWMMVVLLIVELACCAVGVWGLLAERKIQRSRELRYKGEKCESEIESEADRM